MAKASPRSAPLSLFVSDPPYENHFYADHDVSCQIILASPLPRSNQPGSSPQHRLLFAWPAGNSGAALFFESTNPGNDQLKIQLRPTSDGRILKPFKDQPKIVTGAEHPSLGVSGLLEFSDSAILKLSILGSIRTIRDYTEGNGILNPKVQQGVSIKQQKAPEQELWISRIWFDGKTITQISFSARSGSVELQKGDTETEVRFAPGLYLFQAHVNYPHKPCMLPTQLLRPSSHDLVTQQPDAVNSLSFLCTSDRLLAGAWRFFTYFGRDSMLSLLLLLPILSEGQYGAIEVGLSAVLERICQEDGSVCHEENIGDYPAAQAALTGREDSAAEYDYKMIDTDFFLPILMKQYFVDSIAGRQRLASFLQTSATLMPSNEGKTYGQLLERTCEKIMNLAAPFAKPDGHKTHKNLIALKDGIPVGQWRDSNDGLGSGRIPYDVNTGLMPAALRAIAVLSRAGALGKDRGWDSLADRYAETWEAYTLDFFSSKITQQEAKKRLTTYRDSGAFPGPSGEDKVAGDLYIQAIALKEDGSPIEIIHTDACFRLLLLPDLIHSTNPTSLAKHLLTLDSIATSILRPFPAGLYTPVGILIANPAYSTDPAHAQSFTTGAYHGTVVWSWNSLVMLTKGFEVQLAAARKAEEDGVNALTLKSADRDYYAQVLSKMKAAYRRLWDTIEANEEHLSEELWSWRWDETAEGDEADGKGGFVYVPLSHLPTPDGAGQTESNVRQLWSLTFLALERKRELEM